MVILEQCSVTPTSRQLTELNRSLIIDFDFPMS